MTFWCAALFIYVYYVAEAPGVARGIYDWPKGVLQIYGIVLGHFPSATSPTQFHPVTTSPTANFPNNNFPNSNFLMQ